MGDSGRNVMREKEEVGGKANAGVWVRVAKACVEWILAWALDILQGQTIHHLTQFQVVLDGAWQSLYFSLKFCNSRLYTGNLGMISLRNAYHGGSSSTMGLTAHNTWKYPIPEGVLGLWRCSFFCQFGEYLASPRRLAIDCYEGKRRATMQGYHHLYHTWCWETQIRYDDRINAPIL
ncbi:hypothetical protein TSUD_320560 [Trifolium subterraneum]|uniref:Uncharacterized protein n=1 Tax=Trifolium subterraneum TaxID=3900 RepID=A0A2Z6NZC2_TRISU|nr:hypothetical protein TSUD_320560 [Trifolium subterraneum]